jgi:hypothetical protein
MRLKYIGIAPINNRFGSWENGTIREVPDGTQLCGFEAVDETPKAVSEFPADIKKVTRRRLREDLQDKMERDSYGLRDKQEE